MNINSYGESPVPVWIAELQARTASGNNSGHYLLPSSARFSMLSNVPLKRSTRPLPRLYGELGIFLIKASHVSCSIAEAKLVP